MTPPEQEVLRLVAKIAFEAHNTALPAEHEARLMLRRALARMGQQDYTERDLDRAIGVLRVGGSAKVADAS